MSAFHREPGPGSHPGSVLHGSPAALREYIFECAALAAIQTELVRTFAEIGDDHGLEYATRKWVAYTRAALATVNDLRAMTADKGGHDSGPQ